MHVLVTGSNGFVGSELVKSLIRSGDRVTTLVRGQAPPVRQITRMTWDPASDSLDLSAAGSVDAVVHLGGVGIAARRWSPQHKAAIKESRVHGTHLLAKALAAMTLRPPVIVVASAQGIYGDRGDEVLTEDSAPGEGFLAEVGVAWEQAADPARDAGIRVVNTRFGNILGRDGGMVPKLKLLYQAGLGGPIGSGRQWWPWIAVEDVVRAIRFAIEQVEITGPVNTVAPGITRQKEFAKEFASALRRPAFMPLPAWAARIVVGGLADEGLLASQRMAPQVLERHGFKWLGPDLETVFRHIFRAPSESEWR
ncbi:MAG: TIGR01777 family oxidoreductase [Chloroflexi bacterium]|nr:TIGR01777 family oxidoreductase [Chloroflexota bacterium]